MIKSFRHKGLRALYDRDDSRGVRQDQVRRLRSLLARLDASKTPEDMNLPGMRFHPLKGEMSAYYAINVSGNWRLIFGFDTHGDVTDVDLVDYH